MHDASIFGRVSIAGPIVSLGLDLCVPVWERLPPESPCQNSEVIFFEDVFVHRSQTGRNHGDARQVEDGGEMQRRAGNKALK